MKYLIDAYNLLFKIEEEAEYPLKAFRPVVIDYLEERAPKMKIVLVFDSSYDEAGNFPSRMDRGNLEIISSPNRQSADDYIVEYLKFKQMPKSYTVVTSDKGLARQTKDLGAHHLSVEGFLSLTFPKRRGEEKQMADTPQNMKRLREIFEERLKNDPL